METNKCLVVPVLMTVALLLLAACGVAQPTATTVPATEPPAPTETPPPPTEAATGITVTFEGDLRVYHGPERIPAGRIPLTLDVRDRLAHGGYGVGAFTFDEGKTAEDLQASDGIHTPLWAHFQGSVEAAPGTAQETTVILFEGPLYLGCQTLSPRVNANVLGPIVIEPAGSQ